MPETLLILAAQPKDTPEARLNEEIEAIRESLRDSRALELRTLLTPNQERVLETVLEHRPVVVHFCGHGLGKVGILFEDSKGGAQAIDGETLAEFFSAFGDHLQCVVLNACYSEAQATAIARRVPYVVGTEGKISSDAAIRFSRAFYRVLGAGGDVEKAHALGCNAIRWQGEELVTTLHVDAGASKPVLREERGKVEDVGGRPTVSPLWSMLLLVAAIFGLGLVSLFAFRDQPPEEYQFHVDVLSEDGFPTQEALLQSSPGEALHSGEGWLVKVPYISGRTEARLSAHLLDEPLRATQMINLEASHGQTVTLQLIRYKVGVRGIVVDADGHPIPGATVSLEGGAIVLSDKDGFFHIQDTGKIVGMPVQILARKEGYVSREQAHAAGDHPANIEITREKTTP